MALVDLGEGVVDSEAMPHVDAGGVIGPLQNFEYGAAGAVYGRQFRRWDRHRNGAAR
jgi:hypothetical protein